MKSEVSIYRKRNSYALSSILSSRETFKRIRAASFVVIWVEVWFGRWHNVIHATLFSIVLRTLTSERRVSHLAPGWLPGWRTAITSFERRKQKAEEVGVRNKNDVRERTKWRTTDGGVQRGHVYRQEIERVTEDASSMKALTVKRMTIRIPVVVQAARAFFLQIRPDGAETID